MKRCLTERMIFFGFIYFSCIIKALAKNTNKQKALKWILGAAEFKQYVKRIRSCDGRVMRVLYVHDTNLELF